jgi:hypothetical protein
MFAYLFILAFVGLSTADAFFVVGHILIFRRCWTLLALCTKVTATCETYWSIVRWNPIKWSKRPPGSNEVCVYSPAWFLQHCFVQCFTMLYPYLQSPNHDPLFSICPLIFVVNCLSSLARVNIFTHFSSVPLLLLPMLIANYHAVSLFWLFKITTFSWAWRSPSQWILVGSR